MLKSKPYDSKKLHKKFKETRGMSNFTVLINFLTKIPLSKGRTKEDNANPDLNNFFTVLFFEKKTYIFNINRIADALC